MSDYLTLKKPDTDNRKRFLERLFDFKRSTLILERGSLRRIFDFKRSTLTLERGPLSDYLILRGVH